MAKQYSEAARNAQREYYKKYRQTHKAQLKEHRRRYWERKALKEKEEQEKNDEQKENV